MEAGTQQSPLTYLVEPPPQRPTAQRSRFGLREFLFYGRRRGDLFACVDRYVRRVDFRAHTC